MTLFAIPPLVGTLVFAFLAQFVFKVEPRNQSKNLFALLCLETLWWQLTWLISFLLDQSPYVPYLAKAAYLSITFLPFTFYHFIVSYLDKKSEKPFVISFYTIGLFLMALIFTTDLFIAGNQRFSWGNFTAPGPVYPIFVATSLASMLRGLYLLIRAGFNSNNDPETRNRTKYLLLAFFSYFFCTLDFLQVYGAPWYPTGSLFFLMAALLIAYAITRHRLLDIQIVIKTTVVYSILAGTVSVLYLIVVVSLNQLSGLIVRHEGFDLSPFIGNIFLLRQHFIVYIVTCVTTLCLGVFVYLAGKKKETNVVYALYTLAISLWSGVGAFALTASNDRTALSLWRLSHVGVALVPVFFVHYVLSLFGERLRKKKKIILAIIYAMGGIILWADLRGHLFTLSVPVFYLKYYARANLPYVIFFLVWTAMAGYGVYQLFWLRNKSDADNRNRLNYFCLATLFGFIGGSSNFLPTFDIYVPFLNPFGNYAIPIYVFVSVYAIVAQRLMNIRIAIKKVFFYLMFAVLISLLYVTLIFGVHRIFMAGSNESRVLANLISLLVIAVLFKPLEIFMLRLLDRGFFKGSISEIAEQREVLQRELERRERLKSVGILASGMAHEIRNPLTAISTFVEYLPSKYDDPKFRADFQRILKAELGRIKDIVQGLLDFSKPRPPEFKITNLSQIVRDTVSLLSSNLLSRSIRVNIEVPHNLEVQIDPDQIRQVILNLTMNAADAMKEKRGGELSLELVRRDDWAILAVRDTGCGIEPDKIPHLFDPFFTQKDGGTGLGLAIVHSIVEQHRGKIEVRSNAGEGAEFLVYLPINA